MNTDSPGTAHEKKEYEYRGAILPGFLMLFFTCLLLPGILIASFFIFHDAEGELSPLGIGIVAVCGIGILLGLGGYFVQEPNQARVMLFFGKYRGTCRRTGFYWVNPFLTVRKISLRICNMDIEPIKVNDLIGNPVLIGMVLVWKVEDTYRTFFDIDSNSMGGASINMAILSSFVRIQADAALREVTGHFAYDDPAARPDGLTLRDAGAEIADLLEHTINERLGMAGIRVVEARLNYLAYAPEIAAVMLKRQQASAVIAAREKIVEGAVSMVRLAVDKIADQQIADLDTAQKATLVSNLMVVLCSDEPAQPVINTSGS